MARLGNAFPHEGFVQAALGRRFAGCERINVGHTDFACIDDVGVKWIIEAKGETSSTGLDFRTGLGQIVQAMEDPDARYALAMPDTRSS